MYVRRSFRVDPNQKPMPDVTIQERPDGGAGAERAPVLSVVVPCYNERPNVAPMIAKLDAALAGIAWEVIYVDDNSPRRHRAGGAPDRQT